MQLNLKPEPLSSETNTQPFGQWPNGFILTDYYKTSMNISCKSVFLMANSGC